MPLVLLTVANWSVLLRDHRRLQMAVVAALWLSSAAAYAHKWDFSIYRRVEAERRAGQQCVASYYLEHKSVICPTIFPSRPLDPILDQGQRLNASFYRTALKQKDSVP